MLVALYKICQYHTSSSSPRIVNLLNVVANYRVIVIVIEVVLVHLKDVCSMSVLFSNYCRSQ